MGKRTSINARWQRGAAAIEFALVFVLFFGIFYGVVSYSLPLLMMQSFNQTSAEAVRRAIALNPNAANFVTLAEVEAAAAVSQQLAWLPTAIKDHLTTTVSLTNDLLTVRIAYPYTEHPVVPFLVLPGVGKVPQLPAVLAAESSLKLVK